MRGDTADAEPGALARRARPVAGLPRVAAAAAGVVDAVAGWRPLRWRGLARGLVARGGVAGWTPVSTSMDTPSPWTWKAMNLVWSASTSSTLAAAQLDNSDGRRAATVSATACSE